MTHAASLFIIVFTVINVLACMWLLWWTARTRGAKGHGAPATTDQGPERTGHVWDGDLEEFNNPLPRWWLWLFVITVVFGAVYLTFFPGLGNFAGTGQWTSVGAYEAQSRAQREVLDRALAKYSDLSLAQLSADPGAMATARNLFGANCSTCHGSDARGAKGFPNLADSEWLWGGDDESIQQSIAHGRHAVMPPLGSVLGPSGVNEVASYVMSLSGGKAPADWVAAGRDKFATLCTACHGMDGRGNVALGAPDLTDRIWLFGGDFETVRTTIAEGRESIMPAHTGLLGEPRVKLLAAYVRSLSAATAHAQTPDSHSPMGSADGVAGAGAARATIR